MFLILFLLGLVSTIACGIGAIIDWSINETVGVWLTAEWISFGITLGLNWFFHKEICGER